MKHIYIIFTTLMISSSLNAMDSDVTKWQEICKDPQGKQQLVDMYKGFCQKRVNNNIAWTSASWASCLGVYVYRNAYVSFPQKTIVSGSLAYIFALRQTYLLGRNCYRADLADQNNLSYLNKDVLEQLGSRDRHLQHGHSGFGCQISQNRIDEQDEYLIVTNTKGIRKALSGKYLATDSFSYDLRQVFPVLMLVPRMNFVWNDKNSE